MLRYLQVVKHKNIPNVICLSAAKRGSFASVRTDVPSTDSTVDLGVGLGSYILDKPESYDGINAMVDPTWADSDNIEANERVLMIPTKFGERYASTEIANPTGLTKGKLLTANATGQLKAATTGTTAIWRFGGAMDKQVLSGMTLYVVERVEPTVAP